MDERQKIDRLTGRILELSLPSWRYGERFIVFLSACMASVAKGALVLMICSIMVMILIIFLSGSGPEGELYRFVIRVAQATVRSLPWALGGIGVGWIVPKAIYEERYGELLWRAIEILQWLKSRFPFSFVPGDQFPLDALNRLVNTHCVPLIDRDKHRSFVRLVVTHLIYRQSLQKSVRNELDGLVDKMLSTHQARGIGWPIRLKRFFTKRQSRRLKRLAERYDHFFQEWSASYRSAAPRRIEYVPTPPAIDFEDEDFNIAELKKQRV